LTAAGWTVLSFTVEDIRCRPETVLALISAMVA
jgi:very-short-patch-repair endonuclease